LVLSFRVATGFFAGALFLTDCEASADASVTVFCPPLAIFGQDVADVSLSARSRGVLFFAGSYGLWSWVF